MDLSLDSNKNEKQIKKKNGKTASMNQSLLTRIVKEKLPKSVKVNKRPTSSAQDSVESVRIDDKNISFHSNRNTDFEQTVASKYKKTNGTVIHTPPNGKLDLKTLKKVETKLNNFHLNIPKNISSAENRFKNSFMKQNNSTSYLEKLKTELVSKSSQKSEQTPHEKSKTIDYKKLLEELMEAKHKNSKLENEMKILNDKLKSFKSIITMKNNEVELINKKHKEILDEIKKDMEKNKKILTENYSLKDSIQKYNITVKSTITILLDLIEILITQKNIPAPPNITKSLSVTQNTVQQGENNSIISLDMYDSYNNEEDKKANLIEHIQNVMIAKISFIKKVFNLDFDKEIQKIKNWNSTQKQNNELSITNLKLSFKKDQSSSESERSKRINEKSYDFDLSVSNQLTSPKFYNDNSLLEYCKDKLYFNDSKAKEEKIINQTMNDSISLAVGQIESFEEKKNIVIRDEENLEANNKEIVNNSSKRNAPNGMKRLNLDLNDNPTDFNVDIFLSLKNENSFTNNGTTGPVILSPIFGNKNPNHNISFID